jgi:hypothetical protein
MWRLLCFYSAKLCGLITFPLQKEDKAYYRSAHTQRVVEFVFLYPFHQNCGCPLPFECSLNLSTSMQGLEGGLQMFYFLLRSFVAFQKVLLYMFPLLGNLSRNHLLKTKPRRSASLECCYGAWTCGFARSERADKSMPLSALRYTPCPKFCCSK